MVTADDGKGGTVTLSFEIKINAPELTNIDGLKGNGEYLEGFTDNKPTEPTSTVERGPGIVEKTVNEFRQLGSTYIISANHPVSIVVDEIEQLHQLFDSTADRLGESGHSWDVQSATGFSLRTEIVAFEENNTSNSVGHLLVEGFKYEKTLYLQITEATAEKERTETHKYKVTMADGEPLPSWIDYSNNGLLLVHQPIDIETITLRIQIIISPDESVNQYISVDLLNSQIALSEGLAENIDYSEAKEASPAIFTAQAEEEANSLEDDKLFEALFE